LQTEFNPLSSGLIWPEGRQIQFDIHLEKHYALLVFIGIRLILEELEALFRNTHMLLISSVQLFCGSVFFLLRPYWGSGPYPGV
jgi:hypothetical protein